MRVVYAAEFDPAGVMAGHRRALRAAGVEVSLLLAHDFRGDGPDDEYGIPDVIVVAPGIGTGEAGCWSTRGGPPPENDLPPWVTMLAAQFPRAQRVAYFHGSANLAAHAELYAERYREMGYRLAASTLDYAVRMGAGYLPPVIPFETPEVPPNLRGEGEPFRVAHTPTNWAVCSTEILLSIAKRIGIDVRLVSGVPYMTALAVKSQSHATFDHLRGSFSVNSLEAAMLGSVPLFGTTRAVRERMQREGLEPPPVRIDVGGQESAEAALTRVLTILRDDVGMTRTLQQQSREWAEQFLGPPVAARLVRFFEG